MPVILFFPLKQNLFCPFHDEEYFFAKDFRMHFLNACLIVLLYSLVLCGCILQTIRIVGISLAILFSSSIKSCNHKSPMKKSQETAVERFSVYLDTISKSKETTAQIRITKCNRNYKVKVGQELKKY